MSINDFRILTTAVVTWVVYLSYSLICTQTYIFDQTIILMCRNTCLIIILMGKDQGLKILHILKPALVFIPEVEQPDKKLTFKYKLIWTGIITLIYLLCCQIPLYGIVQSTESDPFYWMRVILASNRGSLMELGIQPMVTASMIMQMLAGVKLLKVDQNDKQEKELFEQAQKLIGIIIAFGQAIAYSLSGMYGDPSQIGGTKLVLIVIQLTLASVITILLDDMMTKGYGVGNSGTSLFIAINIAETVLWKTLSPLSFKINDSYQYEGAFVSLILGAIFGPNRFQLIQDAFFRYELPNILNVLATIIIFLVVIYFQGFKVILPLSSNKSGQGGSYPIKLFYTSNMPIILQAALVSNLYFFSQMLHRNFKESFLIKLLGNWQEVEGQSTPVGGLIYYLTPPRGVIDVFRDPIHTVLYVVFIVGACALFSRTWIEVSGQGPNDVAKQLKSEGMFMKGFTNEGTRDQLRKMIPIAATFGGMCVGLLTILADFLRAIGSGTGILLTVTIIYGYIEDFRKQKQSLSFL